MVPAFAAPPLFNRPYSIEADVEVANGATAGSSSPRAATRAATASSSTTGACVRLQLPRARPFELESPERSPPAATRCASSSSRPARPTSRAARACPAAVSSTWTARWSRTADFPHTTPFLFELEGLSCGYDFGAPASDGYEPPFAFNGTLHSVTFDVSGELIADDEAELARLMAQQ